MIHIEIVETGARRCIAREIWVTTNRNGLVATPHRIRAKGVCDGEQIWSLGELGGYPLARIITSAEYEEHIGTEADPELTPEEVLNIIMEGCYETQ